jgi:hypothetical protein
MGRFRTLVFVTVTGAAMLAGCAAQNAVTGAQLSFDRAKGAGAERAAPYHYFASEAYLELAKEELAEMDLAAAQEFAEKSLGFAGEAQKKAGGAR